MSNFITHNENIRTSCVFIGYLILKKIKGKKGDKVSIFDLVESLRNDLKILHYRQFVLALIFLHSLNLIDFTPPYIYRLK